MPSILHLDRWSARSMPVTQRRQTLRISLAVLWNRQRMLAEQAEACGEMLAEHIAKTFPQV